MRRIDIDGTDYRGRSSRPPTNRDIPTDCRHCGSQLAGRYQGVRTIGRSAVRVWACRCGHDRRVPLEVAA